MVDDQHIQVTNHSQSTKENNSLHVGRVARFESLDNSVSILRSCLSVGLSLPSIRLFPYVCLSMHLSICLSTCLLVCLSMYCMLPMCLSACLLVSLSVYLLVCIILLTVKHIHPQVHPTVCDLCIHPPAFIYSIYLPLS